MLQLNGNLEDSDELKTYLKTLQPYLKYLFARIDSNSCPNNFF